MREKFGDFTSIFVLISAHSMILGLVKLSLIAKENSWIQEPMANIFLYSSSCPKSKKVLKIQQIYKSCFLVKT